MGSRRRLPICFGGVYWGMRLPTLLLACALVACASSGKTASSASTATQVATPGALAPGTGITRNPASRTAATTSAPGSLTPGVPASVTSATRFPSCSHSTTRAAPRRSLCSCNATRRAEIPRCESSARVLRVSSAATMSAARSVSTARSVMSPRFPMGVATTYNPGSRASPSMRFKALLLFLLASTAWPAFSADPPAGTTTPDDIDPATGLSRSSVVRPLQDAPPLPEARRLPTQPVRPHIALILPTSSQAPPPVLGTSSRAPNPVISTD